MVNALHKRLAFGSRLESLRPVTAGLVNAVLKVRISGFSELFSGRTLRLSFGTDMEIQLCALPHAMNEYAGSLSAKDAFDRGSSRIQLVPSWPDDMNITKLICLS